ncbi:MAG: aminotransferase class III-fold pyridoxal phosphate-dependent enzyme [Proteobacteria bacterium]|nr:aminotransferase class III-fold pyridoxal phosphate-dependent enzyme [Pseudomonadota bacterium]
MAAQVDLQRNHHLMLHGYVELATERSAGSKRIVGGSGVFVYDQSGRPYLEAAAGMWCTILGFNEPELVDAAIEQMRRLPYYHTVAYKTVTPADELADRLAGLAPMKAARVYFGTTGSDANDFLVKAIRYYNNAAGRPRKKKIIARLNGYHGCTLAASALTGIAVNRTAFDVDIPDILHVSEPSYFSQAQPGESEAVFTERLLRELEDTILREGQNTVAAFIAEPVSGAGGVVIPPAGYHEGVRRILDRYDIKFFADEVITGFYRTGRLWGSQSTNLVPDTMTLAKGLTSAYLPLSAAVVPEDIYEGLESGSRSLGFFGHGSTYSGHPVCCAVALKVLDILEKRNIAAHVADVSVHFAQRLQQLREHPAVGDVRSIGLMGAIEFVASKSPRRAFEPVGSFSRQVRQHAEDSHQVICRSLPGRDACAFSPPLIITRAEVDEMFERFGRALDETWRLWGK